MRDYEQREPVVLSFEELLRTIEFKPVRVEPEAPAWIGHMPFAAWLIRHLHPSTFVELGTHSGNSYLAFCQAIKEGDLSTRCYAIDSWKGDDHAGVYEEQLFSKLQQYHDAHYGGFSRLLRMTFDEGATYFSNGSIDLLHIDGFHTYDAVRHDFENWLPKLAPGAVVLLHDINVREQGFGVWKVWEEAKARYPGHLEFSHSHGLGLIQLNDAPEHKKLQFLERCESKKILIKFFSSLGERIIQEHQLKQLELENGSLNSRLEEIFQSTIWRVARQFGRVGEKMPLILRRPIRKIVRAPYRDLLAVPPRQRAVSVPGDASTTGAPDGAYAAWIKVFDTLSGSDRAMIRCRIARFKERPRISIIMPVFETPERVLRDAIDSVLAQIYDNWQLCVADDASFSPHVRAILESYAKQDSRIKCVFRDTNGHISAASNSALSIANGEYIALLDHDDVLSEHALYLIAEEILRNPTAEIFYSDEDKLDAQGKRIEPYFKPDWNPELFFGQNYLNHLTIYKRAAIERVGGFRMGFEGSQDYDLALRVVRSTSGPIVHIPFILYHWRIFQGANTMSSTQLDSATTAARRALTEYFREKGEAVSVGDVLGCHHRIIRPDPHFWPKVSVIVPTRDHLDVLSVVLDGLLQKTDYQNLEIIIADNDSCKSETLDFFKEVESRGVRILNCPGAFNYSRINNFAVSQSTGDLVLLLNNDVMMIESDWLKEMVRYFEDPTIAAVGPKLLYPDGTLQHGGVVLGIGGVAGHRYVRFPGDEPTQFNRLALAQDVSCVTGACLLTRRCVYDELGGLDEKNLAVAFNDVDFCAKIRQAGFRIIWTPFSVLYHYEFKSRGLDLEGVNQLRFIQETKFMQKKWGKALLADPFYNPNLSTRIYCS